MKYLTSHPVEFQTVHAGSQVVTRIFAINKPNRKHVKLYITMTTIQYTDV